MLTILCYERKSNWSCNNKIYCNLNKVEQRASGVSGTMALSVKIKTCLTFMVWFWLTIIVSVFSMVTIFVLAWMEVMIEQREIDPSKRFLI